MRKQRTKVDFLELMKSELVSFQNEYFDAAVAMT